MSDPLAAPPPSLRPHTRALTLWSLATALAAVLLGRVATAIDARVVALSNRLAVEAQS